MNQLNKKILSQYCYKNKIAPLYIVASSQGLKSVSWQKKNIPLLTSIKKGDEVSEVISEAVQQLDEYFGGNRKNFNLKLDIEGTAFQKKVWNELKKIPYGDTCSYKDIAYHIKSPKAFRAVGTANGQNPFTIIIPCHRVIAANGQLGGYTGGLSKKEKLLSLEESQVSKGQRHSQ